MSSSTAGFSPAQRHAYPSLDHARYNLPPPAAKLSFRDRLVAGFTLTPEAREIKAAVRQHEQARDASANVRVADLSALRASLQALCKSDPVAYLGRIKADADVGRACAFLSLSERNVRKLSNDQFRDGARALDHTLTLLATWDAKTLERCSDPTASPRKLMNAELNEARRAALREAVGPREITPAMARAMAQVGPCSLEELRAAAADVVRTGGRSTRGDLKARGGDAAALSDRFAHGLAGARNNPLLDFDELRLPDSMISNSAARRPLHTLRAYLHASFLIDPSNARSIELLLEKLVGAGDHDGNVRKLLERDPDGLTPGRYSALKRETKSLGPVLEAVNKAAAKRYAELRRTGGDVPLADVAEFARISLGVALQSRREVDPGKSGALLVRMHAATILRGELELRDKMRAAVPQSEIDGCVDTALKKVFGEQVAAAAEPRDGGSHAAQAEDETVASSPLEALPGAAPQPAAPGADASTQ